MKKTQIQWVKEQLALNGEITRNQCLKNYISRLGAIICVLKAEGYEFYPHRFEGDYVYSLLERPTMLVQRVDNDTLPPIKVDGRWVPQPVYSEEKIPV